MSVTLTEGAVAAQPSRPVAEKEPKPAVTQAADVPSAKVAARLSGKRVEALSERTETSTTWVNEDGSLTTELSAGPVRFQRDGEWTMVHYLNASGREVNTVDSGKNVTTTEYDRFGNAVRELSDANRALALGSTNEQKNQLADLGIASCP